MYESKVSTVKSQTWDNFSVMKTSNIKSTGFIPVPCPSHPDYSITNICKSPGCIQPLCPECITAHMELHQKTKKPSKIQNIINTRIACIQKLNQIIQELNAEYQKYQKSCGSNLESFLQKNRKKIQFAKNKIVNFVEKYFEELEQKLQILEVAYLNQKQKKNKQMKAKTVPLITHIEEISQYKNQLESEDYIPALIQLLNDPPKKPQSLGKLQFQDFGEVRIDEYAFETFKTSLQSFVTVQSLLPEQNKFTEQMNKNSSNFSNQMKFSRLGRSSSRQFIQSQLQVSQNQASQRSNSRKKIFSKQKNGDSKGMYQSSLKSSSIEKINDLRNVTLKFEPTYQQVGLIDKNYFMYDKGLLAFFPENQRFFYTADALCADRGFVRNELPQNFTIPFDHQCVVTPDLRLFLIGGRIGTRYLNDCYQILRKPLIHEDSSLSKLSPMNESRSKFGSVFYKGYIYVFGGKRDNSLLSSCERYHILTNKWQSIKGMTDALMSMNVCVLNDKVVKFGGIAQNGQMLNRVDIFFPQNNNWVNLPSEVPFFTKMGSCQINQSEIIIFGGETQFNSKISECFLFRQESRNNFRLYPCSNTLYNQGSFQNSYIYRNSLLAIQNGENSKNKIIMKLQGGKWRFLSC